jgi:trafficking protein particle complex subunit 2
MLSSLPKILSIAVIGKHNQPLFVRSFDSHPRESQPVQEEDLKWHYVAHTSLDVFEERGI